MIDFIVYGAPQGKGRARVGRMGQMVRMFTPAKTVAYEGLVAQCGAVAMGDRPLLQGAVELRLLIDVQVPASWSKRKRQQALDAVLLPGIKPDVDNVIKAIGDGLNGVVWRDDAQITDIIARKRYAEKPQVRVMVRAAVTSDSQQLEAA